MDEATRSTGVSMMSTTHCCILFLKISSNYAIIRKLSEQPNSIVKISNEGFEARVLLTHVTMEVDIAYSIIELTVNEDFQSHEEPSLGGQHGNVRQLVPMFIIRR